MAEPRIVLNGINARTGDYLQPTPTDRELAERIREAERNWAEERTLQWWHEYYTNSGPSRGPAPGVEPKDLASSGWGVIFPQDTSQEVREALRPLLAHRQKQAARKNERYYRKLECLPNESHEAFLKRYGVEPGPAYPDQLPYYLLIVGDPETISYRFQYLLDMQYAVGRIHFDDPEGYTHYAQSVIEAEKGHHHVCQELTFFSTCHENDEATRLSTEKLVRPLSDDLIREPGDWKVRRIERGSRAQLGQLFGGEDTPALLFTAAHGLVLPDDDALLTKLQGAIVCQGWPGPDTGPIDRKHYFTADDVHESAQFRGLIAFLFGCYSAGTPRIDNYPPEPLSNPIKRAPKPFLAPLAKRLLSHPKGGALAVVGHVDRAWSNSFGIGEGKGYGHIQAYFQKLMNGHPVGSAMDCINERFAELSTRLTAALDVGGGDHEMPDYEVLARLWRANNDARNFVVLGDPAVRSATEFERAEEGSDLAHSRGDRDQTYSTPLI